MAQPVSRELAKSIVQQLTSSDFYKHEQNRNNPLQYVWIFITDDGKTILYQVCFCEKQ